MTGPPPLRCWVLTEGHIGMENQALGVAEALDRDGPPGGRPVEITVKRLRPRAPWRWLPPRLWLGATHSPGPEGDPLAPPWPDILISCGKRATAPSVAIRRATRGRCLTLHIQKPPMPLDRFDLIATPAHDGLTGDNVLVTRAAVHRVTRTRLDEAAARFAPEVDHLPRPLITVLIGGSNNRHRLTPTITARLGEQLRRAAERHGAGLLVTPSRRTGADNEAVLRATLEGAAADIWDGTSENPYFGWLGLADHVIVTCDSVSMTSEALATGKPVHVVELEGRSRRIDAFHQTLREAGFTRRFDGQLDEWSYDPPDDTSAVAKAIRELLAARGAAAAPTR